MTKKDTYLKEVLAHYDQWTDDRDIRMNRKNGWNDITSAYWGKLPSDWPYNTKVVDPRIRTSIIEKNARLLNSKLRGRLVPREGGDVISAKINNAKLDFDWDNANYGGTMLYKWGMMDQDARLYASKFGLVYWRTEYVDGKLVFEGNEFKPLDIRNCGIDPTCDGIRDAKWFQWQRWEKIEDLKAANKDGYQKYPGLKELISTIDKGESYGQDRRDTSYQSKTLSLKGLEDRVGEDDSYPVVEVVTEYRCDKCITFSPKHSIILGIEDNKYNHKKIPVVQLKYYPLNDDPLGESEVEPVLPLWKAINAVLCSHLDGIDLRQKPPVGILENGGRMETYVYGPEAQWIMSTPNGVFELPVGKGTENSFQVDYSALVAAFNAAMGDLSQGVSALDPFNPEKTATEVKQSAKQQNTRDQANQVRLAEALEDMMGMWLANNKQFLFEDPTKQEYVLRILGEEQYSFFKEAGLDGMEVPPEAEEAIAEIIVNAEGNLSDEDIYNMRQDARIPKFPVESRKGKKKYIRPKMRIDETGDQAEISITPEDVSGNFDYIADVTSMASGANEEARLSQDRMTQMLLNPQVQQMLAAEGVKIKFKDLLVSNFEHNGTKDATRFFETTGQPTGSPNPQGIGGAPSVPTPNPNAGMEGPPAPLPEGNAGSQMAPPVGLPQQ
ncbi:MAG: hypothetical protein BWY29_00903 [Microgenomates group bacterium ADurb.Bin238]|nr:MAG: hypothetical protein BWY29_00903 [Microgenomates group bacterium ADurb.Bin238]